MRLKREFLYLKTVNRIKSIITRSFMFLTAFGGIFFNPDIVMATQTHGGPEGIYAHQIAHLFYILSMGFFIHWLRERRLVEESGWRFIQYAAFFLILWNLDAFLVHLLGQVEGWSTQVNAQNGSNGLMELYYFAKLDHLLCVPALFFLYLGLRRLLKSSHSESTAPSGKEKGE
jgi:hypothetical protein